MEAATRRRRSQSSDYAEADPFERLSNSLRINQRALDDELIRHPELLYEVSLKHVLAISDRDAHKEYLKGVEARISGRVRGDLVRVTAKGVAKDPTIAEVTAAVEQDVEWVRERKRYLDLCVAAEKWNALKEAYHARGYALHNLAGMTIARMRAESGQFEHGDR